MEQTKNEPKNENKAAPDNGKPKKERKPLTEAQRLKRQKMIVPVSYTHLANPTCLSTRRAKPTR